MSKYTITIKQLMKNNFDFGLTSYPIFDEDYRETLNYNILNYYYESEIGVETAALFKKILNDRLRLIMPKYNIMYNAQNELLQNGILGNVNLKEVMDRNTNTNSSQTNTGTATQTGSSQADNKNLYQDTPQGQVSMETLDSANVYATNFTIDRNNNQSTVTDSSNSSRTGVNSGTDYWIRTKIGNDGTKYNFDIYNKVLNELQNIDMLIINELDDLFMGIF